VSGWYGRRDETLLGADERDRCGGRHALHVLAVDAHEDELRPQPAAGLAQRLRLHTPRTPSHRSADPLQHQPRPAIHAQHVRARRQCEGLGEAGQAGGRAPASPA